MGEITDMPAPTWNEERSDVLKSLAVLEVIGIDTRKDIATLGTAVTNGLIKLADRDQEQQEKLDDLELEQAKRGVKSKGQTERLGTIHDRVVEIEKLMPTVRLVLAVGAILGASLVALVWSVITGQAQIVF